MKTVTLLNAALTKIHEAQIMLPLLPDVIMWRDVVYFRNAVQDSRGVYVEATVHAI